LLLSGVLRVVAALATPRSGAVGIKNGFVASDEPGVKTTINQSIFPSRHFPLTVGHLTVGRRSFAGMEQQHCSAKGVDNREMGDQKALIYKRYCTKIHRKQGLSAGQSASLLTAPAIDTSKFQ
jgi:hypothetical protein